MTEAPSYTRENFKNCAERLVNHFANSSCAFLHPWKNHASSPPQAEIFWIWELKFLKKIRLRLFFQDLHVFFHLCDFISPSHKFLQEPLQQKNSAVSPPQTKNVEGLRRFGMIFQKNLTFQSTTGKPSKCLPAALFFSFSEVFLVLVFMFSDFCFFTPTILQD